MPCQKFQMMKVLYLIKTFLGNSCIIKSKEMKYNGTFKIKTFS